MRTDRYTKIVLTIIAVALCIIALANLEAPDVMAAPQPLKAVMADSLQQAGQELGPVHSIGGAEDSTKAPTSTKPLRWRVMNAFHDVNSANSICGTAVSVRNFAPVTVSVDVEWFDHDGVSAGLSTLAISSEQLQVIWTNANVHLHPFTAKGTVTNTADFGGWANVNADDPRVIATAAIVCRDLAGAGTSDIEAMVNVPTFPVGTTMEYFQAGMPMNWTPPMAAPEVPE